MSVTCRYAGSGSSGRGSSGRNHGSAADIVAIDDVSLTIPDGEFVVIAGANGSGKTTLVRTFNGLVTPDSGAVSVNGVSVETNPLAARTAIGMVFQQPRDQLVAATVGADVAFGPENLGLDRNTIADRVADALAAVNLSDREDDRLETLSGGELERVAIAGALAMEPDHLVCDEPFTGLDEPARRSVIDRLQALHRTGTSVVVVTHDLRDVWALADRVVALDAGRIVLDTTPERTLEHLPELGVRVPDGQAYSSEGSAGADS